MFSKILLFAFRNVTYTAIAIPLATALCFVLKVLLMRSLIFYKLWKAGREFSGPRGLPVLGNLLDVMGDTEISENLHRVVELKSSNDVYTRQTQDLLNQFLQWVKCYPSPFCMWLGPKLNIILHDPDNIKELLRNQKVIGKQQHYITFGKFFGNGLLTSAAKEWHVHRKLIINVFNARALPPYSTFLAEKAQEMVKEMEVELHGKGFEIHHYLSPCTSRMIFGVVLGTFVKFETEKLRSFYNDLKRYSEIIFVRIPRIWLYPDIIFNRTTLGKENSKLTSRLFATMRKAIEEAEKDDAEANSTASDSKAIPGLYMKLPRDRDDFTRQDFLYEVNTMVAAGFHSITGQMDSVMRMLAYHPDMQDKVNEELHSVYGSADPVDRPVTLEDLPRLEYLERVINETMRILPPVGFITREITKDTDIGSCVLPAGCTVIINILSLHRNEKYWPDPLKFDPDRFLPENVAKRIPGCYIPFSIGPRNCIGGKYAMMVAKFLTATILRRYILRTDSIVPIKDVRLKGNLVLEYVEPWNMRIEERNPGKVEAK